MPSPHNNNFNKGGYWTRRPYAQEQSQEAKLWLDHSRPSWLSSDVKAYIILGLSFSLYSTVGQVTYGTNKHREGTISIWPSSSIYIL